MFDIFSVFEKWFTIEHEMSLTYIRVKHSVITEGRDGHRVRSESRARHSIEMSCLGNAASIMDDDNSG